jgi:hypothetical protein
MKINLFFPISIQFDTNELNRSKWLTSIKKMFPKEINQTKVWQDRNESGYKSNKIADFKGIKRN